MNFYQLLAKYVAVFNHTYLLMLEKSFYQFVLGFGEIFFPILGVYFIFFGGIKIGRLLFVKFSLMSRKTPRFLRKIPFLPDILLFFKGWKYGKIEQKIESLENKSEETIDAVVRQELEPYLNVQNKLFTHVNNYLLIGFLGTIVGLVLALLRMKDIFGTNDFWLMQQKFETLYPQLSLAFWTTIVGILFNIIGKFIYHFVDIIPVMEKVKSEFVQKYEGAKHPMERMFEKFINEFSIRFKEDFLQDFSKTVREGFNEGVKEFGLSIDTMKDSIVGTMEKLNNIGSNLETFSNAFENAGRTVEQMDELIKSLNFSLAEHGERILMINEQMLKQSTKLNDIYNYLDEINQKLQAIANTFQEEHTLKVNTLDVIAKNTEKIEAFSSVLENNIGAIQKNNELSGNVIEAIQQLNNNELELANTTESLKQRVDNLSEVFTERTNSLSDVLKDLTGETSKYSSLIKELLNTVASTRELVDNAVGEVKEMVENGKKVVDTQSTIIDASKRLIEQFNGVANLIDGLHQKQESMVSSFRDFIEGQRAREENYIVVHKKFIESIRHIDNSINENIDKFKHVMLESYQALPQNVMQDIKKRFIEIAKHLDNLSDIIGKQINSNFELLTSLINEINQSLNSK